MRIIKTDPEINALVQYVYDQIGRERNLGQLIAITILEDETDQPPLSGPGGMLV